MSRGDRVFVLALSASLVLHAATLAALSLWSGPVRPAQPPLELLAVTFAPAAARPPGQHQRAAAATPHGSAATFLPERPAGSGAAEAPTRLARRPAGSVRPTSAPGRMAVLSRPAGGGNTGGGPGTGSVPAGSGDGPAGGGTSGAGGSGDGPAAGAGNPSVTVPVKPTPVRPAPQPVRVSVRVCSVSGDLPGPHCESTAPRSYLEGQQPSKKCSLCRAPEPPPAPRPAQSKPAQLISSSPLRFPRSVSERNVDATVECRWTVGTDGSVRDAEVVRSSGIREIDAEALRVVRSRKYRPAEQNGVPQSVQIRQPFNFRR